jgi:O-antigen ligase
MNSKTFIGDEYYGQTEMSKYMAEESYYESITDCRIGILDFSLLFMMWFLAFVTSIRNFGRGPGILFLMLNVLLVFRKASNGILVLLLLFYAPVLTLYIPRPFVLCSAIALLGYFMHGNFMRLDSLLNKFFVCIVIFLIFSGMSVLISPNREIAINYFTKYFEGFLATILLFGLINSRESLGRMLKWWVIVAGLALIICTAHYVKGSNTVLFDYISSITRSGDKVTFAYVGGWKYNRLVWPGAEANYFASYLIVAFGLSIAFFNSASSFIKFFWGVVGAMIAVNTIGTFSRSGFLSVVFVLGLFLLKKNIKAIIPVGVMAGMGLLLLPLIPGMRERILGIGDVAEQGASGRFVLWGQAIEMFFRSPLWGKGIGAFVAEHHDATHSTYLQILSEGGLIGISLYCFIILLAFRDCYNLKIYYFSVKHPDVQFSQILIIAMLGLCMMIGTITFQDVKLLWMACGACYLYCQLTKQELGY